MTGRAETIVQPRNATRSSSTTYKCSGRHRRILVDAASAFPKARPVMKLERISATAQTEFPNAKPLSRSHSVSKISAPVPERKRTAQKTATRPLCDSTTSDGCLVPATWDFCELVNIAQRSVHPQQDCAGNSREKRTSDNTSLRCADYRRVFKRQHGNKQ